MLNPSPLSRVFLGASLAIAVALIIFVASSRPSISKQDTQSLLFKPTVDELESSESLPSLDSKAQPVESSVETTAITVAKESTDADNVALSPVNEYATSDIKPPASSPVVLPADSEETESPQVTTEPNMDRAESSPTLPVLAASPAPETTETQAEKKPAEKKPAEKKPAEKKPAEKKPEKQSEKQPAKEQAEKQPAKKQSQEPPNTDVRDPMKRLSREFARRAAAKEGSDTKAVPAAPPADEIFPPTVTMSDTHRKSCVVFVGDAMPAGDLQQSAGEQRSIQQSLGKRLTAVVFWNASNPYALDQFEELQQDLVPFAELGVQTIAIHVGPEPANYAELCQQFAEGVLCLVDPDKSYFQKVALERLPRTYLLDASGKIIWLDIEYSRTTRYELRNALHFSLQDK